MGQHTPGPWRLGPSSMGGAILLRGPDGPTAKDRHPQSHLQIVPSEDARLIAAAPDLLAALVELVDRHGTGLPDDATPAHVVRARAAIRKATEG